MKRLIALMLVLVTLIALVACGARSEFVGLYKDMDEEKTVLISADVDGGGVFVYYDKFIELNRDGSGNIYYEFTDIASRWSGLSEEVKGKVKKDALETLEGMKSSVTWEEDDGYLVIRHSRGGVTTFEKKGAHFFDITDESYILAKIS